MKNSFKKVLLIVLSVLLCLSFASCRTKEAPDDAAMIYKNVYTTEAFYSYWLSCNKYVFLSNFNNGINNDEFWKTEVKDGQTYGEFTVDYVKTDVKYRTVALWLFDKYGLSLSDAEINAIDYDINEKIEYMGSREEMNKDLSKFNMNIEMLREVYIANAKYDKLISYLYSEGGTEYPKETEMADFFAKNYIAVKMITVYAEESDEVIEKLEAGEDIDSLVSKYSKVDYSAYENGIFIYNGDNASNNENIKTAFSLEVGEHGEVANAGTVNIIVRIELPLYSKLTNDEKQLLSDEGFVDYIITEKKNKSFDTLIGDVQVNDEIINKYQIEKVSRNSYY